MLITIQVLAHILNFIVAIDFWNRMLVERVMNPTLPHFPQPSPVISIVLNGIAADDGIPTQIFPGMSPSHHALVQAINSVAAAGLQLFFLVRGWEGFSVRTHCFDPILNTWPQLHPKLIFAMRTQALRDAYVIVPGGNAIPLVGWHSMPSPQTYLCYSDLYDMQLVSDVQHARVANLRYQELCDRLRECEAARLWQLIPIHRQAILRRGQGRNRIGP